MGVQWSSCHGPSSQDRAQYMGDPQDLRYTKKVVAAHQQRGCTDLLGLQSNRKGGQYVAEDRHEKRYIKKMEAVHQDRVYQDGCASGSQCIPEQVYQSGCEYESGLKTADGHSLKTDCVSLADVDRDGKAEPQDVLDAVFMIPPNEESHYETEKGEFLFPEFDPEDSDRSALEVMLRDQVKQLDQKLKNLVTEVKNHRRELDDKHARETHDFLLQKAAQIAREAAKLGVVLCSDNVESHCTIQKRIAVLSEKTNAILQEVQHATSNSSKARSSSHLNQGQLVGRINSDIISKGSDRASRGQLQRS
eukprot:gnl/MRDRNA2_/MRDRNA2_85131_c1_seq5.p1 gnl/MRDRNA2_/MRDRNA2_85131_c1~~gnl/MRDRNA2_/MRDRNA2_85131_c1_seq5.p1  ORF type:complete len:305 (+),score=43.05 gnl/MRDRNA2_/MRDRNA2_85131_c1_seq5:164-1078(+)